MTTTRWLMTARLPDPGLVPAAMGGDPGAEDALARAWLPHVYRWCHRLGGPGFDAEDAAHEVLILVCRKLPGLRDADRFPAWLFGITRRVIANHRRRAWWRRWLPQAVVEDRAAPDPGPEREVEARRAAERVWRALAALKPHHREVLVLCDLEERSASETSALLSIPTGTVKSRLRAAREAFRRVLESHGAAPADSPRTAEVL